MVRATELNGYVAIRSTGFRGITWWLESEGMASWRELYFKVTRNNGGTPDSGRRLHFWAREAGLPADEDRIERTVGTWCSSTKDEVP
jgi:hypothetical protein